MESFSDQIAVVTGASSGIGKAIALGLVTQGATVCLVGRRERNLAEVAEKARAATGRAFSCRADLSLDEEVARLKRDLERDCGHIDILVHSAGVFHMGSVEHAPVAQFDEQFRVNVRAAYLLTQALLPLLRLRQGQIVFINSSVGLSTRAQIAQYSATKHALKALADSLRDEVNSDGIRVLSVYPGRTATPQQAAICRMEGKPYQPELMMQPEDVASAVIGALRMDRTAEITNISIRPMRKS
jgi:short-subunit dehydrogenase